MEVTDIYPLIPEAVLGENLKELDLLVVVRIY